MELLKKLYAIHSLSGKENKICKFIKGYVRQNIRGAKVWQDAAGNMYITKGKSETYPCVVAHLDQVQKMHSKDFCAIETDEIIFGYSPSKRRMEGLGADDKNGIWIALQCLMRNDVMKVAFFTQEEVGCRGSSAADLAFFADCRFVVEPDRRGYKDVITEISFGKLCSKEFLKAIQADKFGYKPECGLMTDVEALRNNGLELSCINVSCGYYQPHTDEEFTVKKDLLNCLAFVQSIIENCTDVYPHELEDYYGGYGRYRVGSFWDDDYVEMEDMLYDIMLSHPDYSADDAWDVYQTNFTGMTREDFKEMYEEYAESFGFELPGRDDAKDYPEYYDAFEDANYCDNATKPSEAKRSSGSSNSIWDSFSTKYKTGK